MMIRKTTIEKLCTALTVCVAIIFVTLIQLRETHPHVLTGPTSSHSSVDDTKLLSEKRNSKSCKTGRPDWLGVDHVWMNCASWCSKHEHKLDVCAYKDCFGCDFCDHALRGGCPAWCTTPSDNPIHASTEDQVVATPCDNKVTDDEDCSVCSCSTFVDVTKYKLPKADSTVHSWFHSGRPHNHENGPIFVDWTGDGVLEYFDSMHYHPTAGDDQRARIETRFELTQSVRYNESASDNVQLPDRVAELAHMYRYGQASEHRIILDEEDREMTMIDMDPHGQNMADLDGDGLLDILISTGGGHENVSAMEDVNSKFARSRTTFLFWGEREQQHKEQQKRSSKLVGKSPLVFRGGRDTSKAAGIDMMYSRGRLHYLLDVNNDGLIDLFGFHVRPASNRLKPGVMLYNQGNRTWSAGSSSSMEEYTISMILTDVDGDGLAQELVLSRSYCYPQRLGPDTDPEFPEYGPYPDDILSFCSTRPVGSLAVYKYDEASKDMVELSPTQTSDPNSQPSKCSHGSWISLNDCHATSMATGDLDGDLMADVIVLYESKMELYLSSSRRRAGSLLLSTDEQPSLVITFPNDEKDEYQCLRAGSVRIVDLNNDGTQELLVMCLRKIGTFLLYEQQEDDDDGAPLTWKLNRRCNNRLGELMEPNLAEPTKKDLRDLCSCEKCKDWTPSLERCDKSRKTKHIKAASLATVDLNNDGFVDTVVTYDFGYTRFFYNVPGVASRHNRFITFRLKGGPKSGNAYGIGATVILYGVRLVVMDDSRLTTTTTTTTPHHQIRIKSSHQHAPDCLGSLDERIPFGLGTDIIPLNVTVRWSNGQHVTTMDLSDWTFSPETYPITLGGD